MKGHDEQNGFSYIYSAKEQAELKRIREKYISPTETENKMERLRRLDASVTKKAQLVSLIFGVMGALILGFGMSMCMTTLGEMLGSHRDMAMVIGIIIGIVGGILISLAYPVYNLIIKLERKKIAPEIIRLTDELMK
ncbi:MAG: hypothetical protein IJD75_03495 [Clostridia bacterium]|nr:hypothetical protein [Clostridia bacterium]MBQ3014190.1 hypothetical protein [Clostridia bacterium]